MKTTHVRLDPIYLLHKDYFVFGVLITAFCKVALLVVKDFVKSVHY